MGICPNCGKQLDAYGFCFNCGYRLRYDPPAVTALKKYLVSPFMIAVMLLTGARFVLSLIPSSTYNIVGNVEYSSNLDIDAVILLLSLILLYIDGKKPAGDRINPRGFKILRVYYIVMGSILAVAMAVAAMLVFVYGNNVTEYLRAHLLGYQIPNTITVIVGVLLLLITVYVVFLYLFIVKTIGSVSDIAVIGAPNTNISTFIIVMCFVIGALGIISIPSAEGGIIEMLTSGCEAAASLIAGVALIKLKNEMRDIRNSFMPKL